MGITAYKRTISETESPRQIERRVLVHVTSRLEQRQEEFDAAERRIDRLQILADGLRHDVWKNEQVWMAFKADLADKDNGLNPELRASLLSLAIWVEKHSQGIMAGSKGIKPLVDVNKSIIQGLSGKPFNVAD